MIKEQMRYIPLQKELMLYGDMSLMLNKGQMS